MRQVFTLLVLISVASAGAAQVPAQEAARFKFAAGQVLTYSVEQTTTISEATVEDGATVVAGTVTKLNLSRRWAVTAVTPTGEATLEMTLLGLKQVITRPGAKDKDGKRTVDQTVIDTATPDGKQQLASLLAKPILTVRLDALGRLLEAKGDNPATAARLTIELPFRVTLPEVFPAVNGTWVRPVVLRLDPPQGTGEKYEATQTVTFKGDNQGFAVLGFATALKAPPKDPAEGVGLVPLLWEGEVYFHRPTGRYAGARLGIKREVADHAGPGTKFTYETAYTEALAEK